MLVFCVNNLHKGMRLVQVLAIVLLFFMEKTNSRGLHLRSRPLSLSRSSYQLLPPSYVIKTPKLPVWPVASGICCILSDALKQHTLTEKILDTLGGRVIPISLPSPALSPFLLLVHHQHSFTPLDPTRLATQLFTGGEGFPAHPHAGFSTVTITIDGGLKHRDSEGISMTYRDGDVQWMRAGRGVIHEEMWDLDDATLFTSKNPFKKIELYQLWVNNYAKDKRMDPKVSVLKDEEIPTATVPVKEVLEGKKEEDKSEIGVYKYRVICGSLHINTHPEIDSEGVSDVILTGPGSEVAESPMSIMQVTVPRNQGLSMDVLMNSAAAAAAVVEDCSAVIYVRRGSLIISNVNGKQDAQEEVLSGDVVSFPSLLATTPSSSSFSSSSSSSLSSIQESQHKSIVIQAGDRGVDILLLVGVKINEPVVSYGPFVQSSDADIRKCMDAFQQAGGQAAFWDHGTSQNMWEKNVRQLNLQGKLKEFWNRQGRQ